MALIAGTSFGVQGEGYVRFSYANSEENILTAIERIKASLRPTTKRPSGVVARLAANIYRLATNLFQLVIEECGHFGIVGNGAHGEFSDW